MKLRSMLIRVNAVRMLIYKSLMGFNFNKPY
jgi:hypothetical protein